MTDREKELTELAREIDAKMAPLRKGGRMSRELVELNTERGRVLDELYGTNNRYRC